MRPFFIRLQLKGHFSKIVLLGLLWAGFSESAEAGCTPVSAKACFAVDDESALWINGIYVGTTYFTYFPTGPAPCLTVPVSLLNPTGPNFLAVRNKNDHPTEIYSGWELDVSCSDGNHSYIDSTDGATNGSIVYYNTPANCSVTQPPGSGGNGNWYDPIWVPSGWGPPILVSPTAGHIEGSPLYSQKSGQLLEPYSWEPDAKSSDSCQYIWFRQGFDLSQEQPPPPPPNLTLTKSVLGPTNEIMDGQSVTYVLNLCNTGGAVSAAPVTVEDYYDQVGGFQWVGSNVCWVPTPCPQVDGTPEIINVGNASLPMEMVFPLGLPANYCFPVTFWVQDPYAFEAYACQLRPNTGQVYWSNGSAQVTNSNAVTVQMACPTGTWSPTSTATATGTAMAPTASPTPSFTAVYTTTFTSVPTATWTPTPTVTPTHTPTATPSVTPTASASASPTSTDTLLPTFTSVPTMVPTATALSTSTSTQVVLNTPTGVSTDTPTDSMTATPTPSPTDTAAATPTSSATSTFTSTFTLTSTSTPTDSMTPTASLTATATPSPTPTNTATATPTDSATATPSPTATSTSTFTATETSTRTPSPTPVLTSTFTPTPTPLGQYTLKIGVYNEAGELIKQILIQAAHQLVQGIQLTNGGVLSGYQNPILIYSQGQLLGSWDGTSSQGNPVSNGIYYVKVDNLDSFGVDTSVTQTVTVNRSPATVSVTIYNEAGEVIRSLYDSVDDSEDLNLANLQLSTNVITPSISPQAGVPNQINLSLGNGVSLTWDGRDNGGLFVTNGAYLIEVHLVDGKGNESEVTREVTVLHSGSRTGQGTMTASPNQLNPSQGSGAVTFSVQGSSAVFTLSASIYDVAGELTKVVEGNAGTSEVVWAPGAIASGLYLAVVEQKDAQGQLAARQILKVLVVH